MKKSVRNHQNELDHIDRRILRALQEDGRMSVADLAEKIGLSASPCHRRVRLLEDNAVIERYVAVVNQRSVGLPVSVFISIKLESQREDALAKFARSIAPWPEILECYLMTGQRDYLLRQQLRAIQEELGEKTPEKAEVETLRERLDKAALPDAIRKEANRELTRLQLLLPVERLHDGAEQCVVNAGARRRPWFGAGRRDDDLATTTLADGHRDGDGETGAVAADFALRHHAAF